jgi:sigma-B regulation protein RsbU (phosphoserine phosphatase)
MTKEAKVEDAAKKQTVSKAIFVFVLAIFIFIISLYFYNIVRWKDYPDFGFSLRSATGLNVVGVVRDHGQDAGIKVGDIIIDVNHKTYASIEELRDRMNWGLGEENLWHIERSGRRFYATITNISSGFKRAFTISGLPFLLGFCYALIGTLVFLMKPHKRASWIFLIFSFTFALLLIYLNPLGKISPLWLENPNIYAYCFTPAVFIHLAASFPEERRSFYKYQFIQFIPYIISISIFLLIRQTTGMLFYAPRPLQITVVVYMAVSVLFFLGSCFQLRITSPSQIVKIRSRMILLGFGISASLPLLDFISNALFKVYLLPGFNYYLPFFLAFPAFLGYSIVKHDLFDFDAIIKRTYGYVLTTGALGGIYGLVVLISNLAFGKYEITKSPMFPLAFILAVVFLFNPIRNRVQRFIDRVFYRLEYDYQDTVGKISETMRSLLNLYDIGKSIMNFALQPMFVDAGAVMLLNPDKTDYDCLIQEGQREVSKTEAGDETATQEVAVEQKENQMTTAAAPGEPETTSLTLPADDPLMQKIAAQKKEVTIYDIQENPVFEEDREACKEAFDRLGATLLIPLIYEDQLTGVISLGRKKSGKFYRREDINLLNTLANQGAVAIENARMVDEVIEKERMEEELSIARDLQVSMLPAECPQIAGLEIAAFSVSAREVGGDFYDFIEIDEEKAGFVVGDVTGKSVSGALVMSASRSVFRMLSESELTVAESMIRANRRLKKDVKTGMFVALLYAVLNGREKSVSMCSAGQTQPVHFSTKSGEATLVETKGDTFPLGILDEADYAETRIELATGDRMIFYTDGIVEAMNGQEEMFGFDRLLEIVQKSKSATAGELLQEIIDTVKTFTGSAPQHDDLTAIVVSVGN